MDRKRTEGLTANLREGQRLALTIPEASVALGLSRSNAYAMAQRGELPVVKIGGRLLVPVAALHELLK